MKAVISFYAVVFMVGIAALVGWIMNLVKLTHCSFDPLTTEPVFRAIGAIVAPIGAVLGYMSF